MFPSLFYKEIAITGKQLRTMIESFTKGDQLSFIIVSSRTETNFSTTIKTFNGIEILYSNNLFPGVAVLVSKSTVRPFRVVANTVEEL